MVFENIVVGILNRLLGDYFENLDTSQLRLGIWDGDVVVWDLLLRNSVLDDMNVPFKLLVGKLGYLRMKIPWQSLYTSPIELNLIDLCLWVAPSQSVKAKKAGVAKAQADSTFTKLISHLTKNVQIKIQTINIRYEDDVTIPRTPSGFEIILKSLEVHTTNPNWKPAGCGGVGGWRKKTNGRGRRREGRKCRAGNTIVLFVLYMFTFVSLLTLFGLLIVYFEAIGYILYMYMVFIH